MLDKTLENLEDMNFPLELIQKIVPFLKPSSNIQ